MEGRVSEEVLAEERVRPPMHPGRVLELEWLEPLGVTVYGLAKAIGVPSQRVYAITRGERAISADTAIRLARWSGMPARFWLGLQNQYDLEVAEEKIGAEVEGIRPLTRTGGE